VCRCWFGFQRSSFSLRTALGLGPDDVIFLLPAGWRAVKDPLYLRATFEEWHAVDPRVRLVLVGPALEADGAPPSPVAISPVLQTSYNLDTVERTHCVIREQ